MVKLPTAKDDEEGVGTGKADFVFDAIASKEINQRVELSGFGGFIFRGDPNDVDLSDGFRWGFGAGFPTRRSLRLTAELHGESQLDDVIYTGVGTLVGEDGSIPPLGLGLGYGDALLARADVDQQEGLLRRRRRELALRDGRAQRAESSFERPLGRLVRLPGAHRLSPRRPRLHAAAAADTATAATGANAQAGSCARREGVLQPVHG